MNRRNLDLGLSTVVLTLSSLCTYAQDAATPTIQSCASPMSTEGKSRQRFDSTALMVVAGELEAQGEAKFHLEFSPPTSECQVESFDVADTKVVATASPFQK